MFVMTKELENRIIELYNSGLGSTKISRELNIHTYRVYATLKKYNIPRRDNKTKGRIYTHDYDYFEKIDTEEKAYWLGFIYADGYVTSSKQHPNSFGIAISNVDYDHLEKFKNDIKATNPIKTYNQTSGYSNNTVYCRLLLTSDKTKNDLINKGVLEHKTDILKFPNEKQVPTHLIQHFIRGYYDGDGCLAYTNTEKTKNTYSFKLLGTEDFLDYINNLLEELSIGKVNHYYKRKQSQTVSSLELSEGKTLAFLNWLYENSTIALNRKYERYCNLCAKHHVEPNGNIRC